MSLPRHVTDAFSSPGVDVLHVEDDEEYGELVRMWVTAHGLVINRVRSRAELLDYLTTRASPRCLLLDMRLQDSTGLSLCDELKSSPSLQKAPIILLSASHLTACECQEHGAIQLIRKGVDGEPELLAALTTVISQHERSQGVVTCGDLRLEPQDRTARIAGKDPVQLERRAFAALLLLVKSAPDTVTDLDLYVAFKERSSHHHTDEPELTIRSVIKNYVSRLRGELGPELGARIVRFRNEGYVYHPANPDSKGVL